MATAPSIGVIFAQAGLSSNIISSDQSSIMVMVVMMSAVLPTLVAQRAFDPWGERNEE
jgi:hypothetical protein